MSSSKTSVISAVVGSLLVATVSYYLLTRQKHSSSSNTDESKSQQEKSNDDAKGSLNISREETTNKNEKTTDGNKKASFKGRNDKENTKIDLTAERTIWILRRLLMSFYHCCRELHEISKSVQDNLKIKGIELTQERLSDMLYQQFDIVTKLQKIQTDVLATEHITADELEESQRTRHKDNEEIQFLSDGFEMMLQSSLAGQCPILPWISLELTQIENDASDEEKVEDGFGLRTKELMEGCVSILKEIMDTEVQIVCKHFRDEGGIVESVEGLSEQLSKAVGEADRKVLVEKHGISIEEFYSHIGFFVKSYPLFAVIKTDMDSQQRMRISSLFTPQKNVIAPQKVNTGLDLENPLKP